MKLALVFFLLIAVLALFGAIAVTLSRPTVADVRQQEGSAQSATRQDAAPSNSEAGEKSGKILRSFGGFLDFIEESDKLVVAISTAVIAAFTIALTVATLLLWISDAEVAVRFPIHGSYNTAN